MTGLKPLTLDITEEICSKVEHPHFQLSDGINVKLEIEIEIVIFYLKRLFIDRKSVV